MSDSDGSQSCQKLTHEISEEPGPRCLFFATRDVNRQRFIQK